MSVSWVNVFLFALVVLALGAPSGLLVGQAAAADHGPILLQGPADPCTGDGHGITNCGTANGSAAAPYRINGWSITGDPAACGEDGVPALVSICDLAHHIVLSDLELTLRAGDGAAAAVSLAAAPNVRIERTTIDTDAVGIQIGPTPRVEGGGVALREVTVRSAETGVTVQPEPLSPLLQVDGADLAIFGSTFEAVDRDVAIRVLGGPGAGGDVPRLDMHDSLITGALSTALEARSVDLRLYAGRITGNGQVVMPLYQQYDLDPVPSSRGSMGYTGSPVLNLTFYAGGSFEIARSVIEAHGVGVLVQGAANGTLRENLIYGTGAAGEGRDAHVGLYVTQNVCRVRAEYNAFDHTRLIHDQGSCSLEARHNWWGRAGGPVNDRLVLPRQVEGKVTFDPWLLMDLDALPRVAIETPAADTEHGKSVVLQGTAEEQAVTNPLSHVEIATTNGGWENAVRATGTTTWNHTLALEGLPLGEVRFWVRACGTEECGVPVERMIRHGEDLIPPVAILRVEPRIVQVGDPVLLDGGRSYSPADAAIAGFRFRIDGAEGEWTADPTLQVTFDTAGTHQVALDVRDVVGVSNVNPSTVTVHVQAASAGALEEEGAPAPHVLVLLLLVLLAAVVRRGGNR